MARSYYRSILIVLACALIASCSNSAPNGSARVTIAIDSGRNSASAPGIAKAAPLIASLQFVISGPDMETITSSMSITAGATVTKDFTVPNGTNRVFSVVVFDAADEAAYAGSTVADLNGTPVALTIAVSPLFFTGTRLAGTVDDDFGYAIARDTNGSIYAAGLTYGDFSNPLVTSPTNTVGDAFFTKFDVSGAELWTRQFGASKSSIANGIAVDGSGNIIVVGATGGDLYGQTNQGYADCFVVKFDPFGGVLWARFIGGKGDDMGTAVALDAAGNVYVTGFTGSTLLPGIAANNAYDVFVAKFDSSGAQQWLKQYGSIDYDSGEGISVDTNGNSYVAGYTTGSFPGAVNAGSLDFFVSKVDSSGNVTTVQRGGPDSDQATSIAIDNAASMIYVAGNTYGALDNQNNTDPTGGSSDIFVAKFDGNLASQLTWMTGSASADITSAITSTVVPPNDTAQGIAVDAAGNVFVAGSTSGAFTGSMNSGGYDSFVIKYQPAGTMEWARQIGSGNIDDGNAIVLDRKGNALVAGSEKGDFDGKANAGGYDAFLMSYDTNGVKQ